MHPCPTSFATLAVVSAALFAVSLDAGLSAQSVPVWSNVSPASGPSARSYHAMAYDSQRGVTVLFGGSSGGSPLGDTWEYDGFSWTQVATSGPPVRDGQAMAYDSQRGVVVMFGGFPLGGYPLDDTWEWDGTTWTEVANGSNPSLSNPVGRYYPDMVYDSQRGKTVLYGGTTFDDPLGDTWEWDGSTWTLVAVTGPGSRYNHSMTYDSLRGVTLMFGGCCLLKDDTWEWDGTSWTQVASGGPPARSEHEMVFDSSRGVTTMYGGWDVHSIYYEGTWAWDGSAWAQEATVGPPGRVAFGMVYDSQRSRPMLFGGRYAFTGWYGDTWEWVSSPAVAVPYGAGCGSPVLSLSAVPGMPPVLGGTAQVALTSIPTPLAFVALGWSNTSSALGPLPHDLGSYGMAGCSLWTSTETPAAAATYNAPGIATYSLTIPNQLSLLGAQIYLQGWAPSPSANPGGVVTSNGVAWWMGNY